MRSAFDLAHYCKYGDLPRVKLLVERGIEHADVMFAVKKAYENDNLEIIMYLIDVYPKCHGEIVTYAVKHQRRDLLRIILKVTRIDPQRMSSLMMHADLRLLKRITACVDCDMSYAFINACTYNKWDTIDFIIHGKFSMDWEHNIKYISTTGCVERFKIIKARCAHLPPSQLLECLETACFRNRFDLVKYINDKYGSIDAPINKLDDILRCVCMKGTTELVMLIISQYKDQYYADMRSFLDIVCRYNCDMIEMFCKHPEFNIYRALANACWGRRLDVVRCLLSKIGDYRSGVHNWDYLLQGVCTYQDDAESAIQLLLPYVNKPDWNGYAQREDSYTHNYGFLKYILENKLVDVSAISLKHADRYPTKTILVFTRAGGDPHDAVHVDQIRELIDAGISTACFANCSDEVQYELSVIKKLRHGYTMALSANTQLPDVLVREIMQYVAVENLR